MTSKIYLAIPFLVTILLVPRAMIFAENTGVNTPEQENPYVQDSDNVGPTGNVDSAYLEILKQTPDFENFDIDEQQLYVTKFHESRKNLTPYQQEVNDRLEALSTAILAVQAAERFGNDIQEQMSDVYAALFDLELLGVVPKDKFDKNKDYWSDRVSRVAKQINEDENADVSYFETKSNLHSIHTDDVSLKNQSEFFYPCFDSTIHLPLPLICIERDVVWGGGTTSRAYVSFVPISFLSEHLGKICLHERIDHRQVIFSLDVDFEEVDSFGNTAWSHSKSYSDIFIRGSADGGCAQDSKIRGVTAGSSASTETYLEPLIAVRG